MRYRISLFVALFVASVSVAEERAIFLLPRELDEIDDNLPGQVFKISENAILYIVRVIDGTNLVVEHESGGNEQRHGSVWVKDFSTRGLRRGRKVTLPGLWKMRGTKQFKTSILWVVSPLTKKELAEYKRKK